MALDTSVLVQAFRNDISVKDRIKGLDRVFVPVPVIGELMIGFCRTQYASPLREKFEGFVARATIISCDRDVADKYGGISADLRARGSMIPVNDVWIAACCIVHGRTLATRDSHFMNVPGLSTEMW